jgi:signal peptidase I
VEQKTPSKKRRWWMIAIPALVAAAFVLFILPVLIVVYVVQPVRFSGTSMMPTYNDGDRLLVRKFDVSPERGDVVVFLYPGDHTKSFIKRVIGVSGDRIAIRDGRVLVNGAALDEPYVDAAYNQRSQDVEELVVPEGYVYVMGDNRDHSNDSRSWGPLEQALIYGEVWARYG